MLGTILFDFCLRNPVRRPPSSLRLIAASSMLPLVYVCVISLSQYSSYYSIIHVALLPYSFRYPLGLAFTALLSRECQWISINCVTNDKTPIKAIKKNLRISLKLKIGSKMVFSITSHFSECPGLCLLCHHCFDIFSVVI